MSWCRPWSCVLAATFLATASPAQEPTPKGGTGSWTTGADGSITVEGKVAFVDRNGDRQERAQGRGKAGFLFPLNATAYMPVNAELEIKDGRFSVTIARKDFRGSEPPAFLSVSSCFIGEVPVLVETQQLKPADTEFVLQLRAVHDLRLKVVDQQTRQELDGVEVFKSRQWNIVGANHPGPERDLVRVVGARRSPCVVAAADQFEGGSVARFWVRAPGYAWMLVDTLWTESAVRDVPLVPGGSLRATLDGKVPGPPAKVAVRCYAAKADHGPLVDSLVVRGKVDQIEGLPAGEYEVRLEQGEWFRNPKVLAKVKTTVEAGRTAEVELKVTEVVATPAKVKVRGILVMPPEWNVGVRDLRVQMDPMRGTDRWAERHYLQDGELVPGEKAGEYRLELRNVFAGRYAITVNPGNHLQTVTVAENDSSDLRIEVSPPIEVVLRIVDAATKEPRKGLSLHWNADSAEHVGGSVEAVQAAADSNEIRFRAAAGRINVSATNDDFVVNHTVLQVAADAKEFEIQAHRVYGVTVELYEGSAKLPMTWDSGWDFELKTLEGERAWAWSRSDGTMGVLKPGTYLLAAKGPDGYQPVADRQVKVTVAPFPVLAIKVARK